MLNWRGEGKKKIKRGEKKTKPKHTPNAPQTPYTKKTPHSDVNTKITKRQLTSQDTALNTPAKTAIK